MTPKHHLPTRVAPLDPTHLPQLRQLLNAHLGLLAPGWALTEDYIASHLQQNPGQAIVDPWVSERKTLCALEGERLVAAAHLLRYSRGSEVGPTYAGAADIAWCVAWAEAERAASALLAAATRQMHAWGAANEYAWDAGLPVGPFVGVPDVWPHIAAALTAAGFQPTAGNEEVVLGGALDAMPAAGDPPLAALVLQRRLTTGPWASREMRFTALLDGQQVGKCEVALDLTDGGALPALRDWAQLTELAVADALAQPGHRRMARAACGRLAAAGPPLAPARRRDGGQRGRDSLLSALGVGGGGARAERLAAGRPDAGGRLNPPPPPPD